MPVWLGHKSLMGVFSIQILVFVNVFLVSFCLISPILKSLAALKVSAFFTMRHIHLL